MKPTRLTWDTLDWAALDRLRDTFLAGRPAGSDYWSSYAYLDNYDFTFAQRIAWKWDAVLRELKARGWTPPPGPLLDWGCGSGIASRRVVEFFGPECFESLRVFDRSPRAMDFAAHAARERFHALQVEVVGVSSGPECQPPVWRESSIQNSAEPEAGAQPVGTLVISHVLNELDEAGGRALRHVIDRARAVLWLEPGTFADSRSLIAMREALLETFHAIAPCTHQCACGLRAPENERHWCHHFASPPAGIMADANWVRFAQRAGIDLRSLPYSFLVLERKGLREPAPGLLPDGWSRIIGTPRRYKGYAKIFSCQSDGVRDLTLQKRDAPALFKALKSGQSSRLQSWEISGDRIKRAQDDPCP